MDDWVPRILRAQAWERAKAELMAMEHTYWSKTDEERERFDALYHLVKRFIAEVEDNGYQE